MPRKKKKTGRHRDVTGQKNRLKKAPEQYTVLFIETGSDRQGLQGGKAWGSVR